MDIYGEKKNAARTVGFLCVILLFFVLSDLLQKDKLYSETENRMLAQRPEFNWEKLINGDFMDEYETYLNDQFAGRDNWVTMKTRTEILSGKKLINGVYLGEEGYLFEQHLAKDFTRDKVHKRMENLWNLIKAYPQTKVMPVPTADNIITEKLPAFASYYDQQLLVEQIQNTIGASRVIDVFPILKEHKEEDIYYRTDHHWTTLGAYYAYTEFAKAYGLPERNYLRQEPVTVTEDFLGTLHSKVNLTSDPDSMVMFSRTLDKEYTITYDGEKQSHSFYEESYLEGKDKYGYFLDGNHGFVEIERESFSSRELFVIKDSYANCMIPLLAHHYKKIYVVDLRYYNGSLLELMKECDSTGNMDVLVLYNCVNFIEDFQIR